MEKIRFSIIIPAFNVEEYVSRAIDSVLNQDFKNYELIIVNDASTDNTLEVVKKYEKEFNKFKLINHKENKESGGARNTGLNIAEGEYIIFLDADDYLYENDVLSKINNLIGDKQVDVVYLGFKIGGNRNELVIPTPETCTKEYKAGIDIYPNVWSKCWNLDFLNKNNIRFVENRYYEDVLFVYKAIMKVEKYLIADFPVHHYISGRKNSMTTTLNLKNIYDTIDNIKDMMEIKIKEDTKEIDMRIKREIDMCKKRLEDIYNAM